MLAWLNSYLLPISFFATLLLSGASSLILLHPRTPARFVRVHVGIYGLSVLVALLNLSTIRTNSVFGPWHLDSLAWLTALFVLVIGFVVQRFSIRYLFGDRHYPKYFALLTLTTGSASLAWLCDDLRWLLVFWGGALTGLLLLLRLNKDWKAAKMAIERAVHLFAISWLLLSLAILWIAQEGGHWQLSAVLADNNLANVGDWEKTGIHMLLALAVAIPAAQYPFHRWLLDSVFAPTPVSAVMHAGIVNAGGIILARFAPLFSDNLVPLCLIVLSSFSVFLGTGMMWVQADYKRQLVGSTIAQMGFMLIQCALGAYLAAVIHAVIHGLFKAALFLQAGSAAQRNEWPDFSTGRSPFPWKMAGGIAGLIGGGSFWLAVHGDVNDLISALLLGWSLSLAWTPLVALGYGRIRRIAGFLLLAGATVAYFTTIAALKSFLQGTVQENVLPPASFVFLVLFILVSGRVLFSWLTRHRASSVFAVLYLWLLWLSEPRHDSVESHPNVLGWNRYKGGGR